MYQDDLAGEPIDKAEVSRARELETGYFKQKQVYEKVPIQEARDGGHQVLGTRRAHRSRLVAKDIETLNSQELFAATPPVRTHP